MPVLLSSHHLLCLLSVIFSIPAASQERDHWLRYIIDRCLSFRLFHDLQCLVIPCHFPPVSSIIMVPFVSFALAILFLPTFIFASPVPIGFNGRLVFPCFDQRGLLCRVPVIDKFLCFRRGSSGQSVDTPLGKAKGSLDTSGATRFPVKYGSAARWGPSSMATTWQLP